MSEVEEIITRVQVEFANVTIKGGSNIIYHMVIWRSKEQRPKQMEIKHNQDFGKVTICRGL